MVLPYVMNAAWPEAQPWQWKGVSTMALRVVCIFVTFRVRRQAPRVEKVDRRKVHRSSSDYSSEYPEEELYLGNNLLLATLQVIHATKHYFIQHQIDKLKAVQYLLRDSYRPFTIHVRPENI
eukprot:998042-Pyramimonas_sp.AAC.2